MRDARAHPSCSAHELLQLRAIHRDGHFRDGFRVQWVEADACGRDYTPAPAYASQEELIFPCMELEAIPTADQQEMTQGREEPARVAGVEK